MGKAWLAMDMSGFTRLRHLNLEKYMVSQFVLSEMHSDVPRCDCSSNVWIGDHSVAQIAKLTQLEHLHFRNCGRFPAVPLVLSETGMLAMTSLCNLKLLSVEGTIGVTDQLLIGLSTNLTGLQLLNVRRCPRLTNKGYKALAKLSSLLMLRAFFLQLLLCRYMLLTARSSDISHSKISSATKHFTSLHSLRALQLICCSDLMPEHLKGLSSLKNLLWLDLIDCPNVGENITTVLANVAYLRRTVHLGR